jgi:hypothetical protein
MSARLALTVTAALALAACGSDGPTGSGGNTSTMSATVGGENFAPPSTAIIVNRTGNAITFSGEHTVGNTTTTVTIALPNVTVPGTLTLSPNFASQFGRVTRSAGSASTTGAWSTVLSPGNGSVTITQLAASRVAGTFQFTGQFDPTTTATGQLSVTSGTFDIRF